MKKVFIFLCAIIFFCPICAIAVPNAGIDVSQVSLLRKYKDISHNIRVLNKMREQARNLSEEEKGVLKKYILGAVRGEDTYLLINCNLRGNLDRFIPKKEITKPLKYRLDYYANQLSKPVEKIKLPQNIILYRGIDDKGIKLIFADKNISDYVNRPINEENLKFVRQKLVGAIYTEKGFMSTSYDINCAKQTKFIFEVNAPKNLQAVLLEELGKRTEKEVLINYGTKWEVTDVVIDNSKKTKKNFYKVKIKFVKM